MTSNGVRVLQIGADRSKRGILVPGSAAYQRQKAYAEKIGNLDIIGFSLESDPFSESRESALHVVPTRSVTKYVYGLSAMVLALRMPRPDAVSAQDPFEAGLVAFLISRYFGAPLHVQVHTDFLSPNYSRMSALNRVRVSIAGFVLSRASRVRVVSQRIKDSIEKTYMLRVPVTVLPIFVDIQKIRSAVPPADLVSKFSKYSTKMLYVGRLEPEKHPCLALRAFARSAPEGACLVVVGTGSEAGYLRKLAAELQIENRVFFEGEQESAPYYGIADLVLVTSRYEGYGLVIVEALARGVPVLSTDVGAAREVGAIVAEEREYADALKKWCAGGPTNGSLGEYPYGGFEEYVQKYCDDIASAVR